MTVVWLIVFGVITFLNINNEKNKIINDVLTRLEEVAGVIVNTVDGDQIDRLLVSNPSNNPNFDIFAYKIDEIKAVYSGGNKKVPVSLISIFTVENKVVKTIYRTDRQFEFFENASWYDEISKLDNDNRVITKRDYIDKGKNIYSSFSQLNSQLLTEHLRR